MLFKHPQWKGSKRKLCAAISAVSLMPLSGMALVLLTKGSSIVSIKAGTKSTTRGELSHKNYSSTHTVSSTQ